MFKKLLFFVSIFFGFSTTGYALCTGGGTVAASHPYTEYLNSTHFVMCLEDDSTVTTYVDDLNATLEHAYENFVTDYGFAAPNGGSQLTIYISNDLAATTAWAGATNIQFSDAMTGDNLYTIPAHELFHTIQYEMFGAGSDGHLVEGGAHWASDIQDVTDSLNSDSYPNNWLNNFWSAYNERGFSLFWDYMTEQLTTDTDTADPGFGVGVMREAYEIMETIVARDGRDISLATDMNEVLRRLTGLRGMTMTKFYKDFLIATYAKELGNPFAGLASPFSGLPRWDFVEDEEFTLDDLVFYQDGDTLTSGGTLSYDNAAAYGWWLSTDGFQYYGGAEPDRIVLDSGLTSVEFAPVNVDNASIHYAAAIKYTKISDGSTAIRTIHGLNPATTRTISLYVRPFRSARYTADELIIIPFTLDEDPQDGDGNNFDYSVTGS